MDISTPPPALNNFPELSRPKGDARRRGTTTRTGSATKSGAAGEEEIRTVKVQTAAPPGNLLGVSDGAILAGALEASFANARVDSKAEKSDAMFFGKMEEFAEDRRHDPLFVSQLRNEIKKCGACGKVCGYNLTSCNSCGAELPNEVTHSHNIFTAFIYGVAKVPFPAHISIRKQTEDMLVFDDILALSPCHLNVIPTHTYVPDWRFLLRDPKAGLELVTRLEDAAWECVREQFVANESWRIKFLKPGTPIESLRAHIITGCNFPPSQFQFHIQYILPPLLPYQYSMYLDGNHLTFGRFFPLDYIKRLLALDEPVAVQMNTSVDEIRERFDKRVSYEEAHAAVYERSGASHCALANWQRADFALTIEKGGLVNGEGGESKAADDIVAADKAILQNYGRPYGDNGKPTGTYYKFARKERLPEFGALERSTSRSTSRSRSQTGQ